MAAKSGGCVDEDHRKLPMFTKKDTNASLHVARSFVYLCSVILLLALMSLF